MALLSVIGFSSSKIVQVRIFNVTTALEVVAWTSVGVSERADGHGYSVYFYNFSLIAGNEYIVDWRDNSVPVMTASEGIRSAAAQIEASAIASLILSSALATGVIQSSVTVSQTSTQKLVRGDVKLFTFNLGSGWNLTNRKAYLCVKKAKTLPNSQAIINRECSIINAANGVCSLTTTAVETGVVGTYYAEIEVRDINETNPRTALEFILIISQDVRQ